MPKSLDESSKFLYSILKQVETKHINWDLVATENGIPTSAAASLRWYRLKKSVNPGGSAKEETKSEEGTATPPAKRKRKRKAATPELKTAQERGQSKSSRESS